MSSPSAKTALQQAVPGLVLVGIVVLLTVSFNILGAIGSAVLTGMMLGVRRPWKWHLIPVSFIFPAVTFGLLEFSNSNLPPRQRILLSVLCWGGFVVTCLLAHLLVCLERPAVSASQPADNPPDNQPPSSATAVAPEPARPGGPVPLTLPLLAGQWSCETVNGQTTRRILQVSGDEVVLCVTDGDGHVTCQAKGRLKVE